MSQHCCSPAARPRRRRGFTLIEILVVITIIAMLMGMTSFAVWRVILNAKQAKIAVEIDQLTQAMAGYKQARIQYPPCMATADIDNRKKEFLRHISLAFTNANYGSTAADFDVLRNRIFGAATGTSWGYNYASGSNRPGLDLNTLDQAEALVFWLGGFPTPVTSTGTLANRKLFGFHRDEDNPFRRSPQFEQPTPMQFRTDPMFDFQEERLIDIDGDGWLEYCPLPHREEERTTPYVYFDSFTYGSSSNVGAATNWKHLCYPRPDNSGTLATRVTSPTAPSIAAEWGVIGPMPAMLDGAKVKTTQWANPNGIQILCGGLDARYGASLASGVQRCITFPKGEGYYSSNNYGSPQDGLAREELDNQTNLSPLTIDGARSQGAQ